MTGVEPTAGAGGDPEEVWRERVGGLAAQAVASGARVQRLELDGRTLWLKRPERPESLRWRLQKGNPRSAFDADLAGLRFLAEHGVPAAAVLHEGADHFVTADCGPTLDRVLATAPREEAARAVAAAAETLARLHHAGARHGRPKLRDICWDGRTARLIDLERFRPRASARAMGLDWAILLHSLLESRPQQREAFDAAVRSYRALAPAPAVAAGTRFVRRLGWMGPGFALALRLWPRHPEIEAAARLPEAFAAA